MHFDSITGLIFKYLKPTWGLLR